MPSPADGPRWAILPNDAASERRLASELGIPPLVARVLVSRGLGDVARAREFLSPSIERDWADPLCIPGMAGAVARVERALDAHETIAVFGDFDVDGMTSTCLLTLALRRMGADVHPFIPHRFGEGYGLSREALARVREACGRCGAAVIEAESMRALGQACGLGVGAACAGAAPQAARR